MCEVEEVRDEYKWGSEDGAEKERGRERESEGGLCLSSTRLLTFD